MNHSSLDAGEKRKGIAALIVTAILWSTSGVGIKLIEWHPMAISGARSFVAFLFLFAVTRDLRLPKSRYDVIATVSYSFAVLSFVVANKLTTSANAIFLQYLSPAFAAILGYFILNERLDRRDWSLLIGMLVGMVLFFAEKLDTGGLVGNITAVFSGICVAMFIVSSRRSQTSTALQNLVRGHLLTAVIAIPFYFETPGPGAAGLGWIVYMGIVQIGVSSFLFSYGIHRFSALSTSMITLLEPIMNPVWVFLIVGEAPSLFACIGGAVILSVIVLRSLWIEPSKAGDPSAG